MGSIFHQVTLRIVFLFARTRALFYRNLKSVDSFSLLKLLKYFIHRLFYENYFGTKCEQVERKELSLQAYCWLFSVFRIETRKFEFEEYLCRTYSCKC